jgi:hypothetical protein
MRQEFSPPQYSSDGRWWWNGRSWVPVDWPVQTRSQPARPRWAAPAAADRFDEWDRRADAGEEPGRRPPAVLWVGLLALVLLLLLSFGAVFGTLAGRAGQRNGGQATQIQTTPAPVPTPAETPATSPIPTGPDAYRSQVDNDVARFQSAAQAASQACSGIALGQGVPGCQAALQALDNVVQQSQADLDETPVPACLQPADQELRTALTLYDQGIQEESQAIDQRDVGEFLRGAGTVQAANSHGQHAVTLLQATC